MNEPVTVSVPKEEYDRLIRGKAYLEIILETAKEDGYVTSGTVNAVKRLLGYPVAVRTADKGDSGES